MDFRHLFLMSEKIFPPLYSMENSFSKIKNVVRSKLRQGVEGCLKDIVLSAVKSVNSEDCNNYFRCMARNITNCAAELPYYHQ